ncbi:hypothetical protein A3A79_04440 [Candidatus Gottesmanbacteria bacterium RIFCSPLOWO2_01_FULL_43_11b]|uniref:Glycosyltransferase RgtA/B/C/D-like domain-containing protein n=1 Tax=Candidatus Gottesmanbacteria bacterium RIFCSPLOWO2_01_FULL_43_11b TaxID=1798392 RepID=A0A1F6AI75_9BACT|nr:MAG: hypothetical protein A3A79_04440 [Candidatus Gottesmanbacteria bacterium RIFCSPLOWO2_01_FULL_43_11b]
MKKFLLLFFILGVAAYLRIWHISDYMTFLGDEGRDMLVVKRMIVDGKWTLLGPTASVGGFFMGPIYYYFMLPFLWLWRLDPTGPAVMVALFGTATVYVVYRIGRDFFNERVGLAASALYALSPVVIAFSRSSWNPNVVQFFSALLIYMLWKAEQKAKREYFIFAGIAIGIGLQLHYLFSFLGVLTLIWFFLIKKKGSLLFTGMGFLIGYAPFLLFELRHGFPNTLTLYRFLLEGKETGFGILSFIRTISDVSFRLFGRLILRFPQPEWWYRYSPVVKVLWNSGTILLLLTGVGSALFFAKKKAGAKLLALWFFVVVLLFGFYRKGIFDYYFGIFFALPFLLTGLVLSTLSTYGKFWKAISFAVLIGLLYFNWLGRPFLFPPNKQLSQTKEISKVVFDQAKGMPFNFALITRNNSDHAYRYFFEIWGNSPVTIENEAIDPQRKTVADQLLIICDLYHTDCQPLGHPLWEIAGFGRAEIVGTWTVPFVTIFKLEHYKQ